MRQRKGRRKTMPNIQALYANMTTAVHNGYRWSVSINMKMMVRKPLPKQH